MERILKDRIVSNGEIIPIVPVLNNKDEVIRVTDEYIDISYKTMETPSRVLSNLYPYHFDFFGKEVYSIEAAIQSLKFSDERVRLACYEYAGVDAWHLRGMNPYSWQNNKILYTPIRPVNRFSEEYQHFLDEMYYMAFQNAKYRFNLQETQDKKLDHVLGENNPNFTTLTRTEYISRLYALRFAVLNGIEAKEDVLKVLKKVKEELK